MKVIVLSGLFFGLLNLCASDQPAPTDHELLTAAVAACSLAECEAEGTWIKITSIEDPGKFAGEIFEYQIDVKKDADSIYYDEQRIACVVPGFSRSVFGFMSPAVLLWTPEKMYQACVFSKPGKENELTRTFVRSRCCGELRMRAINSAAREAIKVELQAGRGEFRGEIALAYEKNICELLGVEKMYPVRENNLQT